MHITRYFKKRPEIHNFDKRSLSFNEIEIDSTLTANNIHITVYEPHKDDVIAFELNLSREEFLGRLFDVNSPEYKVFRF